MSKGRHSSGSPNKAHKRSSIVMMQPKVITVPPQSTSPAMLFSVTSTESCVPAIDSGKTSKSLKQLFFDFSTIPGLLNNPMLECNQNSNLHMSSMHPGTSSSRTISKLISREVSVYTRFCGWASSLPQAIAASCRSRHKAKTQIIRMASLIRQN